MVEWRPFGGCSYIINNTSYGYDTVTQIVTIKDAEKCSFLELFSTTERIISFCIFNLFFFFLFLFTRGVKPPRKCVCVNVGRLDFLQLRRGSTKPTALLRDRARLPVVRCYCKLHTSNWETRLMRYAICHKLAR